MQRSGTEAIRTQIQTSKPNREVTKITNSLVSFYGVLASVGCESGVILFAFMNNIEQLSENENNENENNTPAAPKIKTDSSK